MRFAALGIAFSLILVAGCGDNGQMSNNGDMAGGGMSCTTLQMDVPSYTGDAAGALQMADPAIKMLAPDAYLYAINGQSITFAGINAMAWDINYYSPSLKSQFIAAMGTMSGHVGCNNITIKSPPMMEGAPVGTSASIMAAAKARIIQDAGNVKLPGTAQSVQYGQFTISAGMTRDRVWGVLVPPYQIVVDDQTAQAIDCTNGGTPCN
jgi:hypothetical protein